MEQRYSVHPDHANKMDTSELRRHFLIENLFCSGEIHMVYSQDDRCIIGGAVPKKSPLPLVADKEIGASFFMERREIGIVNIGGEGFVEAGGESFSLAPNDGLYIGRGTKDIVFKSKTPSDPSKFYFISAPAHKELPIKKINIASANPSKMGSSETSNARTIYKYFDPSTCETCQLLLGMTILESGSVWNTMPCHTHDRRMEVYLYFGMEETTRVFHYMGQPQETRHLVLKNEQIVISPPWSIHSGSGTGRYTFIWAMLGENQNYGDMDLIPMDGLK